MRRKIPFSRPTLGQQEARAASKAMLNEPLLRGPSVERFERAFARFVGVKHAVAVSSGTSALQFAIQALDIGPMLVAVPAATFAATAAAVVHAGAKPLLVDVDPTSGTMDARALRAAIRLHPRRLLGVVPVHLYGRPVDPEVLEVAVDADLRVIEDACQAHGARIGGKMAGSVGRAAAFSFYPTKAMTVGGDGGMLTTNDDRIAERTHVLRDCGRATVDPDLHVEVGYTARMSSAQAAVGLVQLRRLPGALAARARMARRYLLRLGGDGIEPQLQPARGSMHGWQAFGVRVKDRDQVRAGLDQWAIESRVQYPRALHQQPAYQGCADSPLPGAETWASSILSLPLHPGLERRDQDRVVDALLMEAPT